MESMIQLKGVSKNYDTNRGSLTSLVTVDLDVEEGEFITLVGPSGCGKSTMLNIMAGLLEPTTGSVTVNGQRVTGPGPDRGVIFQQYALFPWLTAQQNVEFGLALQKMSKKRRADVAMHYLEMVGLAEFAKALPKELWGYEAAVRHRTRVRS